LAGVAGGCLAVEPITEAGDSVIRILEPPIQTSVSFPTPEIIVETISESVSVVVT